MSNVHCALYFLHRLFPSFISSSLSGSYPVCSKVCLLLTMTMLWCSCERITTTLTWELYSRIAFDEKVWGGWGDATRYQLAVDRISINRLFNYFDVIIQLGFRIVFLWTVRQYCDYSCSDHCLVRITFESAPNNNHCAKPHYSSPFRQPLHTLI